MAVFRVERNRGYTVMSNHHMGNEQAGVDELRLFCAQKRTMLF